MLSRGQAETYVDILVCKEIRKYPGIPKANSITGRLS